MNKLETVLGRYKQRERQRQASKRLAPQTAAEQRVYTELVIFQTITTVIAESRARKLTAQEQALYINDQAKIAAAEIVEVIGK